MDDEDKKRRLRAQALKLSLLAEAMSISGARHGELDLYRSARDLKFKLAEAGALIEVRKSNKR